MSNTSATVGKLARCRMLFWGFFKIAALVVGGGYAIVPAAENEFIHRKKLLTEEELLDMMAIIQSLPGIIAGALFAFTLSIDDFVITFFVKGAGDTTLPIFIESAMKKGRRLPLLNALSVLFIVFTFIVVFVKSSLFFDI